MGLYHPICVVLVGGRKAKGKGAGWRYLLMNIFVQVCNSHSRALVKKSSSSHQKALLSGIYKISHHKPWSEFSVMTESLRRVLNVFGFINYKL